VLTLELTASGRARAATVPRPFVDAAGNGYGTIPRGQVPV
jgi:hypothetical protein